ncbi:hypothetical protein [Sphingomonas sp. 2SG]|uniref:hypothetical protein n=1 Tax=Sphingomonas sp. 2SG TaxID=2502201 RepID=UPI0010F70358|nr:hypothetical protein [Sphingomonas sp. 2SG]
MADYDPDDKWQDEWMETVHRVGVALCEKHLSNPWPHISALPVAMRYLATELWHRRFSQTKIREAFELAILELLPYAAGYEKRLWELSPNSGHLLNTVIGRHELRR